MCRQRRLVRASGHELPKPNGHGLNLLTAEVMRSLVMGLSHSPN